jgi:flagellar motor switch protein FliG
MSLPAAMISPPPPAHQPGLNRKQKATIIVRLLQSEGLELSLADLPDDLQIALAEEMSAMRHINRATLQDVVGEFVAELEDLGLTFPRGVPRAIDALQPTLSDTAANRLRKAAGVDAPDNPWEWIGKLDDSKVLPLLAQESIEVAAVALSKLPVSKSASIIGQLPGERARKIAYMISRTTTVSPNVVQKIGDALVAKLQNEPARAFENPPAERVGSILNYARAATRDDVLEGLFEEDQEFGEGVKRAIFTFKDIKKRVDPRDVPKIMREVAQDVMVTAVAGAAANPDDVAAAEFLLENMSQRLAAAIRDEVQAAGKVKASAAEEAHNTVIEAIRLLNETGDLNYREEEDDEE